MDFKGILRIIIECVSSRCTRVILLIICQIAMSRCRVYFGGNKDYISSLVFNKEKSTHQYVVIHFTHLLLNTVHNFRSTVARFTKTYKIELIDHYTV